MSGRYELTDGQWQRIEDLLPDKKSDPERTGADNRLFVNAVLWVLRSGARWHDLPERYGKSKTIHKRFGRWADAGVWEQIFRQPIEDPDNKDGMLETTKVRLVVDGRGRPLKVMITPGQQGDTTTAPAQLDGIPARQVLADKAYDSNALRAFIKARKAKAVIPPNRSRAKLIHRDMRSAKCRTRSSDASTGSRTSDASPPAMIAEPLASGRSSTSPAQRNGGRECRFVLERIRNTQAQDKP